MTDLFSWTRSTATRDLNRCEAPRATLSIEQVVDQIISINRSATVEYLSQFKRESLDKYLDHLRMLHGMLVEAMKAKQSTDAEHITHLRQLTKEFRASYLGPEEEAHAH